MAVANKVYIVVRENLLSEADGIIVRSIRHSFDGASTLTFTRDIEFDIEPIFQLDDEIMCIVNGVTLFAGWLVDISPELNDNEQRTYSCADSRFKLSKITFKKEGSARIIYNANSNFSLQWRYKELFIDFITFSSITTETGMPTGYDILFNAGKTYGQIMIDVLQTPGLIPTNIISEIDIASIEQMNTEAPEMSFTAMNIEEVLRTITDKAGKFGYYITPAKKFIVYKLDSLTQKNVYAGQIGQTVEAHPEYDVWQANLNFSTADVRTKCTIEGRHKWQEQQVPLTPLWDIDLEKNYGYVEWWAQIQVTNTTSVFTGASGDFGWQSDYTFADLSAVFRRYKYDLSTHVVELINDGNGVVIGHYPVPVGTVVISPPATPTTGFYVHSMLTSGDLAYLPIPLDAQVDMDIGIVMLSAPAYASSVYGSYGKILFEAVPVYMRAMVEISPFTITVGSAAGSFSNYDPWEGKTWINTYTPGDGYTTYGLDDELYIYDEDFIYEERLARYNLETNETEPAGIVRDDSGKMIAVAIQMLEQVKNVQSSGTIKLDSIKTDWDMGNSVNIQNLSAGLWNNLNAVVLAVEWNLTEEESTTLTISTKQYIGGSPNYEELKRRILISMKIKDLEARIADLEQSGGGSSGSIASNPGKAYSNDVQASGDGLDFTAIRKDIQAAMDANYFTIQKHDHTSDSQGGSAFAGKGGYLL